LEHTGTASFVVDLTPDRPISELKRVFSKPRGKKSLSTYLKRTIGLHGAKLALFYEYCPKSIIQSGDMDMIADKLKSLDIPLKSCRPLDEAISSAGGVCFDGLDDHLMIRNMPGVFCAGEMIDWEAPTGGYLITGCFAQGRQAAEGAIKWLEANKSD
jgi:predicted flavoprotein YhiN